MRFDFEYVPILSAVTSRNKCQNLKSYSAHFYLFNIHLQFPPYATNETGRPGGVGRRELGHGNYFCLPVGSLCKTSWRGPSDVACRAYISADIKVIFRGRVG